MSVRAAVPFSERRRWAERQAISYLMQQGAENPNVLSLAAGLVDSPSLPVDPLRELMGQFLADDSLARTALQYGSTAGSPDLRRELLGHLATLEQCPVESLGINPDHILLTTGSQQLLGLLCEALFNPGDIALVAAPTYFVFLGTLAGVGARIISVAADEHGMNMEALEETLRELEAQGDLPRVRLIYVVSDFENPSGVSLSTDRRRRVVELAREFSKTQRIFVLEDAAYRELRYDGDPLPSVWSFDPEREFVILAQTFSKSFSPGLRVGYGILPQELVGPLTDLKGNVDFGSAHFNQTLLARALATGLYHKHVAYLRQVYTVKRDALANAAEKYFRQLPGVHWERPQGGLYLWMSLPKHIDTRFEGPLLSQAGEQRVMYVPGHLCYPGPEESRPHHQMRLTFGMLGPEQLDEAMRILSQMVTRVL